MQQVFGKKLKCHFPSHETLQRQKKEKVLVIKGVSNNITLEDFKQLLDFNKITHAKTERIKSKRTGRDLPIIKIKYDDRKRAEALISGGLICQKTGIIFKVEEFSITPLMQQCFKCQGFGQKAKNCTKNRNVLCGEVHSHKKCPNKDKKKQNVQTLGGFMSPITEAVLRTRIKPLGNMWSKIKFLMPPL